MRRFHTFQLFSCRTYGHLLVPVVEQSTATNFDAAREVGHVLLGALRRFETGLALCLLLAAKYPD